MPNYNVYPAVDGELNFPPPIRQALANSPEVDVTVEAKSSVAASNAVDAGIKYKDVITGSDSRALRATESDVYAIPFSDEEGYIAGGFQIDGSFNTQLPMRVQGVDVTATPITNDEWAHVYTDDEGYVAFGIRKNGKVHISAASDVKAVANTSIGYTRSDRTRVACIGDSLTNGYFDSGPGKTADAYPAKLQALVPSGVTVFNLGSSGWASDEVAAKLGALELRLSVKGGVIPATVTAVYVTSPADLRGLRADAAIYVQGSLGGVPGQFFRQANKPELYFSRKTAGVATPVPDNTLFIPEHAGHDYDTSIVFLGRNDYNLSIVGGNNDVAEQTLTGVKRIVDWHSRDLKQVLVVSPTTNTGELRGTWGWQMITKAGRLLQEEFGPKYFDLRKYLIYQAIYDLGITPTAADVKNMEGDTLPPSIMDGTDTTHYSRATAALVAAQMNNQLRIREWI